MAITKGGGIKPRRCVLYGTAGIGKTTWGCSAPKPLLLPIEDNGGVVTCDHLDRPKNYADVKAALNEASKATGYETLVIDSLDWLERLIHADLCEQNNVDNIEKIGYGKGYTMALNYWRGFLQGLDFMREKGMTIVCLAHSQIQRYEAPGEQSYDRFNLRLDKKAAAFVGEWCDDLFFMSYEVFISKEKGALKAKAVGDGTRVIHTRETPAWVAKNRLRLDADLLADFGKYMEAWPKNV